MNQITNTDAVLPDWLAKHAIAIAQLSQKDPDFCDLLEDHTHLIEAIRYWTGKSAERVEEFTYMVSELELEIMGFVNENLAMRSN